MLDRTKKKKKIVKTDGLIILTVYFCYLLLVLGYYYYTADFNYHGFNVFNIMYLLQPFMMYRYIIPIYAAGIRFVHYSEIRWTPFWARFRKRTITRSWQKSPSHVIAYKLQLLLLITICMCNIIIYYNSDPINFRNHVCIHK